jgi:hypothetical protein
LIFKNKFKNYLKMSTNSDFKERYKNLLKTLQIPDDLPLGPDAVVSGSLVWHVLTQDLDACKWFPNDIDIFCCQSAVSRLRKFLKENSFKLNFIKDLEYTQENDNIVEEWSNSKGYDMKDYEQTLNYFKQENKNYGLCDYDFLPTFGARVKNDNEDRLAIQLIIARDPSKINASELIVGKFDFPALENYYDGKNLYINNIFSVINRKTEFRTPNNINHYRIPRMVNRYNKYKYMYGLDIPEEYIKCIN